jgi:hypothetical protein
MIEIGKKVVCIKQHSQDLITEGEIYTVMDISELPCECKITVVNVGVAVSGHNRLRCSKCNASIINKTGFVWFNIKLFRPIDYAYADKVLEELFENVQA